MQSVANAKQVFKKILFEVNIHLKRDGLLEPKRRFFEFAPLLVVKFMYDSAVQQQPVWQPLTFKWDWEHFSKLKPQAMLQTLNQVILPALVKAYNHHTDFFQPKSSIKNSETLKKLVNKLATIDLMALDTDVLGDVYEYFLHQDSLTDKQDLGIYFTPRHIVKRILDLMELKPGDKIYDPTCGAGGFLTEAYKALTKSPQTGSQVLNKNIVFGRELSDSIKIAKMNLIMAGVDPKTLCQMDTLQVPIRAKFSVVLANFPFSQKTHYSAFYGFKGQDANPVFLKHIIEALIPGGIAGVIMPDRLLFNENPETLKIKKILLETCQILAVIQLHEFVFMPYTKQPTSILIFKKGEPTKSVWFFDVREDGFKKTTSLLGRICFPIAENDFGLLKTLWRDKPDSSHSFSVSANTIVQQNYHLSMNRYKRLTQPLNKSVKLGELCDIFVGETPNKTNTHFYGGNHLFVRIQDLNQPIIKSTQSTLTDEGVRHSRVKPLKKHTLLFSFRFSIAKVAFAGRKLYTNEGIARLVPKDNRVLSQYLYYILPQLDYSSYIHRGAKGPELNKRIVEKIQIPLPPLPVQKKLIRTLEFQEARKQRYLKQVQKILRFKNKKIQEFIQ
jgi:type I restriction enzyme M protein